ncbi:MAG: hypothetical protein MUP16_01305 [Sedimentisphaerales bacterium]|nr:hypothetical protein [Sedimentisphaerales bacterium]
MKKRIKYSNEPIEFEVVDDFLPRPKKLSLKKASESSKRLAKLGGTEKNLRPIPRRRSRGK